MTKPWVILLLNPSPKAVGLRRVASETLNVDVVHIKQKIR